jgi:DNA-binding transcriptional LysR family regulator
MNWDDVDVFCHVVTYGSFTSAAQAMNRPKSSVSASVTRLEAALAARLLERTTRRVRMTEAGESLYHSASPLLERLRQATSQVQEQGSSISGMLRIAAPYEFGTHHLGEVSCQLMAEYPELQIVIDVVHASIDLFERQYDIVFSMIDRDLASSSVVATRVFTPPRGLFASPALLAQRPSLQRPEELIDLPLLAGASDSDWEFTSADGAHISVPIAAPRLRSANAGIRKQAALAGLGVARITASFCEDAVRTGELVQLLPNFVSAPLKVYALLPARRLMPAKVRLFLDILGAMQTRSSGTGETALTG